MTSTPRTILASLALLGIGIAVAVLLLSTAPTTEPVERERGAKLVQTVLITPRDEEVVVTGFGNVIPSRQLTIQPEVSGRVTAHHEALMPGGLISAGEELLCIDRSDYELALAEQQAAREEAVFELEVEEGRQTVAARELEELKDDLRQTEINKDLVLRTPHLRRARAMVAKADNAIAQAELNLARCTIKAPFNAVVLEETVEVEQLVATRDKVATLAGTDSCWIRVNLPLAELQRIQLPTPERPGAPARVVLETGNGSEAVWNGHVTRLLGDFEDAGRMARVLVRVPDPLGLQQDEGQTLPLLLGSYVRVEIKAGRLENTLEIPRAALRAGDRVWLAGDDKLLRIRDADVLWRRKKTVLIANLLQPGERLVVSELKSPLPGMALDPQPLEEGPPAKDAKPERAGTPAPKS
jgi:RND family efflux transporter MFP subunit